jgi:hypothetical protein
MSNNDWYIQQGQARMAQISAQRSPAVADLEQAWDDEASATDAIQRLADLDLAAQSLSSLYNRYVVSQMPPPEPSKEERAARPWDRMDRQDQWNLANSGKYGADPNAFLAGEAEVARRRARGE